MTEKTNQLKKVESALEVLVLAYHEEHRKPKEAKPGEVKFKVIHFADIKPCLKSRKEIYREAIIDEPMAGALRLAIREIGEYIYAETGSINAMSDILENITSRHPTKQGSLASAIDHAWDGIGRGEGDAGWCC
jgi:hypothetical protein